MRVTPLGCNLNGNPKTSEVTLMEMIQIVCLIALERSLNFIVMIFFMQIFFAWRFLHMFQNILCFQVTFSRFTY